MPFVSSLLHACLFGLCTSEPGCALPPVKMVFKIDVTQLPLLLLRRSCGPTAFRTPAALRQPLVQAIAAAMVNPIATKPEAVVPVESDMPFAPAASVSPPPLPSVGTPATFDAVPPSADVTSVGPVAIEAAPAAGSGKAAFADGAGADANGMAQQLQVGLILLRFLVQAPTGSSSCQPAGPVQAMHT